MIDTRNVQALLLKGMQERITGEPVLSVFLYIQKKFYNVRYILLYFLIITIRQYGDNTKRSENTTTPL